MFVHRDLPDSASALQNDDIPLVHPEVHVREYRLIICCGAAKIFDLENRSQMHGGSRRRIGRYEQLSS